MLKFENTNIFTGYLKQLLSSFNLPKYRVYTLENAKYHQKAIENNNLPKDERPKDWQLMPEESPEIIETITVDKTKATRDETKYPESMRYVNYIKNDSIQKYIDGQWVNSMYHYHYNKKELNQTRNLIIKNNSYDSYTHEYLGDYLRFQRDYNNLDLMPLYNCFSNVVCPKLDISFITNSSFDVTKKIEDSDSDSDSDEEYEIITYYMNKKIEFNTNSTAYKIYMLPVKLFKKYTIAIDCPNGIELCCGFYNTYYDNREKLINLPKYSYKKFNSTIFSAPVIFDKLTYENLFNTIKAANPSSVAEDEIRNTILDFAQYEHELKLFIKVPTENISSITILEGDYTGFNQQIFNKKYKESQDGRYIIDENSNFEIRANKFVFNFATSNLTSEDDSSDASDDDQDYTEVKLPDYALRPFVPYTELQLLQANTGTSYPFADRLIEYLLDNTISQVDEISDNIVRAQKVMELNNNSFEVEGGWEDKMRLLVYDYMTSKHPDYPITGIDRMALRDSLGYIDKDVEKYYTAWKTDFVYDKNGERVPMRDSNKNIIYQPAHLILKDDDGNILRELYKFILRETGEEATEVPVYKTVTKPLATISNIDIYDDIYLDNKKGGTK